MRVSFAIINQSYSQSEDLKKDGGSSGNSQSSNGQAKQSIRKHNENCRKSIPEKNKRIAR